MKALKALEYILLVFFFVCVIGFFYGEFTDTPLFPSMIKYMEWLWPVALLAYSITILLQGKLKKKNEKDQEA